MSRIGWIVGAARGAVAAAGVCLALAPTGASAGPCSNDIAELSRILSASPTLSGTPTTGALSGAMPGAAPAPGGGGTSTPPSPDRTAGTTADSRQGGTAGTRELNAVVGNQVATSPEDVRRQQQGLPTAAAAAAEAGQRAQSDRQRVEVVPGTPGSTPAPGERMTRAKADLETARALDQRDDGACRDAITRIREALGRG